MQQIVCINSSKFIKLLIALSLYFITIMFNYHVLVTRKPYYYNILLIAITVLIWLYILFVIYTYKTSGINMAVVTISIIMFLFILITYRIIYYYTLHKKLSDRTKVLLNFITNILFFLAIITWFVFIYNTIESKNMNHFIALFIICILISFSYLLNIQRKYNMYMGPSYFLMTTAWVMWIYYTSITEC